METVNAKITEASLGFEDHGILTILLTLDFGDSMQCFGGFQLSNPYDLHRWVTGLLDVFNARDWKDLKGKYVRVQKETGWNGKLLKIGDVIEDKWFTAKI